MAISLVLTYPLTIVHDRLASTGCCLMSSKQSNFFGNIFNLKQFLSPFSTLSFSSLLQVVLTPTFLLLPEKQKYWLYG